MNLSISQIKKTARTSLKGFWGTAVLLTFIVFLISVIIPIIIKVILSGGFSNGLEQQNPSLSASLFQIVWSFALIPFSISVYWFYLAVIRRNQPKISNVFEIYKDGSKSFKLLGAALLQGLFVILWSLLLFIPGIVKSIAYSMTFFILRDHPEYTVTQAITESRRLMNGYKWKYFLLNLSFIGWGILSFITLGIGLLWLIPYTTASLAAFYNELTYPQGNDVELTKEII